MMKISLLNFMITFNDSSTVEVCGDSFLVIMHTVDHHITLNCPIQVDHLSLLKIKRFCV